MIANAEETATLLTEENSKVKASDAQTEGVELITEEIISEPKNQTCSRT